MENMLVDVPLLPQEAFGGALSKSSYLFNWGCQLSNTWWNCMVGPFGLRAVAWVKDDPRKSEVAAIALTAYARLEDRTEAIRAGFQNHGSQSALEKA